MVAGGRAMTEIRPRTIYSVLGFSMTSAVSIIRPDVPTFAMRSASRRELYIMTVNPVTVGIWQNSAEMYARYRAFLLITKAGWRDITIVRDNSVMQFEIKYTFWTGVTLVIRLFILLN